MYLVRTACRLCGRTSTFPSDIPKEDRFCAFCDDFGPMTEKSPPKIPTTRTRPKGKR